MKFFRLLLLLAPSLLWSCENMDYDISKGIDKEITLFSDEVSVPVGDVGPISPKQLLNKSGMGEMLGSFVTEDPDGYLVVENSGTSDASYVMLLAYTIPDQTKTADVPLAAFSGTMQDKSSVLKSFGFSLAPQVFTLTVANPLTEEISVSGKMTLSSQASGETPAETLYAKEFSGVVAAPGTKDAQVLRVEQDGVQAISGYKVENVSLHLPASILTKDPLQGLGAFNLAYNYKAYLSLTSDLPVVLPIEINDLKAPLGQYQVKEAVIRMDVVNEIPLTLVLDSVDVLSEQADATVSVTPGLTLAAGCPAKPVTSPLEIEVKAKDGTIPDISGIRLNIAVKAPVGVEDARLGMNQKISFNNIRATVSGGITIQGL